MKTAGMLATIPSPTQGVWHVGPFPLRAYAFCILASIAVAVVITQRRWKARGGDPAAVLDIATWAVPFGVIGGRIYHVLTSPEAYFGTGGEPIKALYIWEGGLGIWGAIVLGGVGAYIACRRAGIVFPAFADAVAPGIIAAQAVGRWGNWFNNELYGKATDLPWGLQIHEWDSSRGEAARDASGHPIVVGTFHPTFLYESIWDLAGFFFLLRADRKYKLGHGRVFALYCCVYTAGRVWIEALRIDPAEHILGLRLNVWTSMIVFVGGLLYLVLSLQFRPGREKVVQRRLPEESTSTSNPSITSVDSDDIGHPVDVRASSAHNEEAPATAKATGLSDSGGSPGLASTTPGVTGSRDKDVGGRSDPESPPSP